MARRGRPYSGDLEALKSEMWACIRYLSDTIQNSRIPRELRLRACSAMAANCGVYRQLLETSEITAMSERLAVLEAAAQAQDSGNGYHERRR